MFTSHPDVIRLAQKAFPDYNGKKFRVEQSNHPINCASYWDGGSRSYFRFVRLADEAVTNEMPAQSAFDQKVEGLDRVTLVPGLICVEHHIFCGKDSGITIFYHPDNAPRFLEKKAELTFNEKVVLYYTRHLKNSYAGETNCRFKEASRSKKITQDEWNSTSIILAQKGFLKTNKLGHSSITQEGYNAIADIHGDYQLKREDENASQT